MTDIAKLLGKEWKKLDHEKPNKSLKKYLDAAAEAKEEVCTLHFDPITSSLFMIQFEITLFVSCNLKQFESTHRPI